MNWMLAFAGILAAIAGTAGFHAHEMEIAATLTGELRVTAPLLPGPFADFIRWVTLGTGLVLLFVATKEAANGIAAEYYASLLVAVAGPSLVARSNDLVTLFLALEMISIPTYVLLYLPNRGAAAQEAAIKYFLLGIVASGILLFGLSHLYGHAGTTNITAMIECLRAAHTAGASPLAVLGRVLVVAGL